MSDVFTNESLIQPNIKLNGSIFTLWQKALIGTLMKKDQYDYIFDQAGLARMMNVRTTSIFIAAVEGRVISSSLWRKNQDCCGKPSVLCD